MRKLQCKDCKFFSIEFYNQTYIIAENKERGFCRRFPPTTSFGEMVEMRKTDWCGEFKVKHND